MMGIDLGQRRIGLAISDATATLARPLKTIERAASDEDAVEALRTAIEATNVELGAEDAIGCLVIGLPTRLDGTPNDQTARVRKMVALLSLRLDLPIVLQDERLSSHEAEQRLSIREKDWRKRKAQLDAAAAAVILQDYLDAVREAERGAHGMGQTE
jgi:putative Holliday junction resolvase